MFLYRYRLFKNNKTKTNTNDKNATKLLTTLIKINTKTENI